MSRELALPPDARRAAAPLAAVLGVVVTALSVGLLALSRMLDLMEES